MKNIFYASKTGFTQLEKFINNILKIKVDTISKKVLNIRRNNLGVSLTGFTLVEVLIVFAIIGIVSVFYLVDMRPKTTELLKMDTTRLAADIRYIRSMAASRAVYNGVFPEGGYGIVFKNGAGLAPSWYKLYVNNPAQATNIIKEVKLSDKNFRLIDPNGGSLEYILADVREKSFAFKSENAFEASYNLGRSSEGDYQIAIYTGDLTYYRKFLVNIGRQTQDEFVWSNVAITYENRDIECGNGIVEAGESCERFADDDSTIIASACFPAGAVRECEYSYCGDGVIAGDEQCEKNTVPADLIVYPNLCPNAPVLGWCYECDNGETSGGNGGFCLGGVRLEDSLNCCNYVGDPDLGRCTDCKWENKAICFKQPKICYAEEDPPISP